MLAINKKRKEQRCIESRAEGRVRELCSTPTLTLTLTLTFMPTFTEVTEYRAVGGGAAQSDCTVPSQSVSPAHTAPLSSSPRPSTLA